MRALGGGREPEVRHFDQDCQLTSSEVVVRLQAEGIKISCLGKKHCYDEILPERPWRTVKSENVCLLAYSDGWDTEFSLARFLWSYGHVRPNCSLGGRTPHEAYNASDPCSSWSRLTMQRDRTFQQMALTLILRNAFWHQG